MSGRPLEIKGRGGGTPPAQAGAFQPSAARHRFLACCRLLSRFGCRTRERAQAGEKKNKRNKKEVEIAPSRRAS